MAGGIARDFSNLLTVIMSYSELGRFALEPNHPAFEALEQIDVAARRAGALTRQRLIFARKEAVDPKVIELNQLVESVAKLLHRVVAGESGPSVIERLSRQRPSTKVLFVSGYPGDDISRLGVDQGSFRFLAKPYSSEQLAQRVRRVLDDQRR